MFAPGTLDGLRALASARAAIAGLNPDVPDSVRVDRIRALEELRCTVAAAQAAETAAFAASQRAEQLAKGIPAGWRPRSRWPAGCPRTRPPGM